MERQEHLPTARDDSDAMQGRPFNAESTIKVSSEQMPQESSPASANKVLPLNYFRAAVAPNEWSVVATCRTAHEWHATRQPLIAANIVAVMRDNTNETAFYGTPEDGAIDLLVPKEDVPLAMTILEASRSGKLWCPHCGSIRVQTIHAAWHWYILAVIFVGMVPFWPASKICEDCGRKSG